jgi:hypothetical protein
VDWGCPVPGTAERIRRAHADATVVHVAPTGTAGVLAAAADNTAVLSGDGSGPGAASLLRRLHTSGRVGFGGPPPGGGARRRAGPGAGGGAGRRARYAPAVSRILSPRATGAPRSGRRSSGS